MSLKVLAVDIADIYPRYEWATDGKCWKKVKKRRRSEFRASSEKLSFPDFKIDERRMQELYSGCAERRLAKSREKVFAKQKRQRKREAEIAARAREAKRVKKCHDWQLKALEFKRSRDLCTDNDKGSAEALNACFAKALQETTGLQSAEGYLQQHISELEGECAAEFASLAGVLSENRDKIDERLRTGRLTEVCENFVRTARSVSGGQHQNTQKLEAWKRARTACASQWVNEPEYQQAASAVALEDTGQSASPSRLATSESAYGEDQQPDPRAAPTTPRVFSIEFDEDTRVSDSPVTTADVASAMQPLSDELSRCFASCGTIDGCAPKYPVTFHLANEDLQVEQIGFDYHARPLPPAELEACVRRTLPKARVPGKTPVSNAVLIPTIHMDLFRPDANRLGKLAGERDARRRDFDGELARTVRVAGVLDLATVANIIRAKSTALKACQTPFLDGYPPMPAEHGFVVQSDGAVDRVSYSAGKFPVVVEDCLVKQLRALRFPKASHSTTVSLAIPVAHEDDLKPLAAAQAKQRGAEAVAQAKQRAAEAAARRNPDKLAARLRSSTDLDRFQALVDLCVAHNEKVGAPNALFGGARLYALSQDGNFGEFDRFKGNCFASVVSPNFFGSPQLADVGTAINVSKSGVTMLYAVGHAKLAARFLGKIAAPTRRYLLPVAIANGYTVTTNKFNEKVKLPSFRLVAVIGFNGLVEQAGGKTQWRDLEVVVDNGQISKLLQRLKK